MNNEFKNYYKILGVTQHASKTSIENAARREMEYANPMQRDLIREAASVLLNDELRARYDVVYNENVDMVERLKQNAISESDFIAISKMDNRIKELETKVEELKEEKKPETKVEESKEEKKPETKVEEVKEEKHPEIKVEESKEKKPETKVETKTTEEPIKNNVFDEEILAEDAKIKAANRKRIINNSLIIGGSTILFGPVGTLVSAIILKKKGKFKLQKLASKGKIKEIKTLESKIIEAENEKLEREIDTLLNSPLKDNQSRYKLEIAKLRYQNQVDLLQKRIEFKKNEKNKLGGKAYNRLYVLGLEMICASSIKFLEGRKKRAEAKLNVLNSYNPNKDKTDRLTKIQTEIDNTNRELQNIKLSDFKKNQKAAKINRLNTKKIQKINKMALKKNGISRNQVVLAVFNSAKNKIANIFSRNEKQTEETMDLNSFSNRVR